MISQAITSYEQIPPKLVQHILTRTDSDSIQDIPLNAINDYVKNMTVDTFMSVMGYWDVK